MRIEQEAQYVGDNRWQWSVWVDGTDSELDEIEAVEYTLHPTFPNPVQLVRNRTDKFRLRSAGWGEFEINAHARLKDGSARHLKHRLSLSEPGEKQGTDASDSPQKVFVSYAAADAGWGDAIRDELVDRGLHAMTSDDMLEGGSSWKASITSAIDEADLVVGIFSDATSSWVSREVSEAVAKNIEVVPIAVGSESHVPDWLEQRKIVHVSDPGDLRSAVDSLVERAGER